MRCEILQLFLFNAKSSLLFFLLSYLGTVTVAITITTTKTSLFPYFYRFAFSAFVQLFLCVGNSTFMGRNFSFAFSEPFRSTAKMQMNFEQFWCEAIHYN